VSNLGKGGGGATTGGFTTCEGGLTSVEEATMI